MIKRRKNKGGKFARMNEEERARYMQHRAEFELEAKRRKQQLIATFTKNKLKREEAFSKLNLAKINEKWRYVLRRIKCKELYEDVKHVWDTFERTVNIKNATIFCLHKELKIADSDHKKLHESHIVLIDNIIGNNKQKLKTLHDMYKLNNIKCNSMIDLNELKKFMEQNCKKMYHNIAKKNISFNEKQSVVKTQNAVNILNVLYLEEDIVSDLVHQSFLKIENLWDQLHKVINEYKRVTENKKKQYEYLKQQDSIHQVSIFHYPKTYLQLQNCIENLKHHTQVLLLKRKEQIVRLKTKDIDVKNKFKSIKHEFITTQITDSSQLKKMSVTSNEILKCLRRIVEKGSTLLEIIKICSTLEPVPFNLKKYVMQNAAHAELSHANIPISYSKINKFWEQYNHIKVDNIFLRKKGDELCVENKNLKHKLQVYITTVSGIPILCPTT